MMERLGFRKISKQGGYSRAFVIPREWLKILGENKVEKIDIFINKKKYLISSINSDLSINQASIGYKTIKIIISTLANNQNDTHQKSLTIIFISSIFHLCSVFSTSLSLILFSLP